MNSSEFPEARRRSRAGMTLIEVIVAVALFAVLLLYTLLSMMSLVRMNRLTAIQIAATAAMRAQMEEVMTAARDNIGEGGIDNQAKAALHYYSSNFANKTVALGSNGAGVPRVTLVKDGNGRNERLVYTFAVPVPGDTARLAGSGAARSSDRAVGEAVFYLLETAVPPLSNYPEFAFMWVDLGDGAPQPINSGFDMNGDGIIDDRKADGGSWPDITQSLLDSGNGIEGNLDINRLPVDITITYYSTPAQQVQDYQLTRRMIVM